MKKVILVLFAVLFAIPTFAESDTYKSISIHMSGGRKNADGTITYAEVSVHSNRNGHLSISCKGEGDKVCPATVTVLVTVVAPVAPSMPKETLELALDILKKEILSGATEGKFMCSDIMFSFEDGKITEEGLFEFKLNGIDSKQLLK